MRYIQLLYSSLPAAPIGTHELVEILEPSQARNRRDGITGLLAFSGDAFLQVLEGEEAAVWSTYERIVKDSRHSAIRLLGVLHADARTFPDWDMGYAGFQTFKREIVQRYAKTGTLDCSTLDASKAFSLLAELSSAAVSALITV